jgi:hypothetical protein
MQKETTRFDRQESSQTACTVSDTVALDISPLTEDVREIQALSVTLSAVRQRLFRLAY